jgi:cytochrome P450
MEEVSNDFKPSTQNILTVRQQIKEMVRKALAQAGKTRAEANKSIYPSILDSEKVPASEKEFSRCADDAIFLMVAGTDAPAQALAITMFHILNNTEVHQRLTSELRTAFPDVTKPPSLDRLKQLPYMVRTSDPHTHTHTHSHTHTHKRDP